jgi:hypothetical protein
VLDLLETGALTVATARLLAPHLTPQNHDALLDAGSHKSKRQVEDLVARISPKPDVPSSLRKLPDTRTVTARATDSLSAASSATATGLQQTSSGVEFSSAEPLACLATAPAARRPIFVPLSPDRYRIQFTASASTRDKLRRAQELLRHAVPSGDPAEIFDRALTALLEDLERRRFGAAKRPRTVPGPPSASRNIPAHVKRAVTARDGAKCAFVAVNGHECAERGFLEFHHVAPYARGGLATEGNIQVRCRVHNGYEAEAYFGPWKPHDGDGAVREGSANYGAWITRPGTS